MLLCNRISLWGMTMKIKLASDRLPRSAVAVAWSSVTMRKMNEETVSLLCCNPQPVDPAKWQVGSA